MYFWLFFKSCHCQKNDEPDGGGEGQKRVGWEIGTVIFFLPFIFFTRYFFFISKSSPLFLLLGLLHLRVGLPTGTITVKSANHPLGSAHSRSRQIQHFF
jgi:hypothetical protein